MGVWIETAIVQRDEEFAEVTPFVGVWIETQFIDEIKQIAKSHPSWVCGLKHVPSCSSYHVGIVTPFVGVWIETASNR